MNPSAFLQPPSMVTSAIDSENPRLTWSKRRVVEMSGYFRRTACAAVGALSLACSPSSSGPPFAALNPAGPAALAAEGHGLVLVPVVGEGTGIVSVQANARKGEFVANTQDVVHVRGVTPNALLHVVVAADVGLGAQQADGTCQRANLGFFMPLPLYPGGPPATLETSPGGSGTVHVVFGATNPAISNGSELDLMFRVVDAVPPAVPTIDLRTACFTIEIT
jgi:hypothetical protein